MPGAKPVLKHIYKKSEIGVAIEAFLRDAQSNDAVIITED